MNSFYSAYNKVISGSEGGYVNDPSDLGGETYAGVARKFNPNWKGWAIIDSLKGQSNFLAQLKANALLLTYVMDFYKAEYWDKFQGDKLEDKIATELFDQAVNLGVETAIKYFQRALNILNQGEKYYPNATVDGQFGQTTYNNYFQCMAKSKPGLLFTVMNLFQGMHYIGCMEKREVNEKYIGWFNRVEVIKF